MFVQLIHGVERRIAISPQTDQLPGCLRIGSPQRALALCTGSSSSCPCRTFSLVLVVFFIKLVFVVLVIVVVLILVLVVLNCCRGIVLW